MFSNIDLNEVNLAKVIKTVRGSLKKAIFYLGAKVPYEHTNDLVLLSSSSNIQNYMCNKGKEISDLLILDAKIRLCDDILDNKLSKISPKPVKEMEELVKEFKKNVPEAKKVADLFKAEIDLIKGKNKKTKLEDLIRELIEIRPSDFFVLVEKIIDTFGTNLTAVNLRYSFQFFYEFQRLRDLLDDIMSIEEDTLKNDYNSIVLARASGVSYHFFDELILEKFTNMKTIIQKIKKHSNKEIFKETLNFWGKEYQILFKKLLIDYYIDLSEFRKSYLIIKQL